MFKKTRAIFLAMHHDTPSYTYYERYCDQTLKDAIAQVSQELMLNTGDDELVDAWPIISINQWDQEQQRLLALSKRAIFRIKYDFSSQKMVHYTRYSLDQLRFIQKGYFHTKPKSFTRWWMGDKIRQQFGMRIFVSADNTTENERTHSMRERTLSSDVISTHLERPTLFQTYRVAAFSYLDDTSSVHTVQDGDKLTALSIISRIIHTRHATQALDTEFSLPPPQLKSHDGFYLADYDISRNSQFGAFSVFYNSKKIGFWKSFLTRQQTT